MSWELLHPEQQKWITAAGDEVRIMDMTTEHIKNALNQLYARGFVAPLTSQQQFENLGGPPQGEMAAVAWEHALMDIGRLAENESPAIIWFTQELARRKEIPPTPKTLCCNCAHWKGREWLEEGDGECVGMKKMLKLRSHVMGYVGTIEVQTPGTFSCGNWEREK